MTAIPTAKQYRGSTQCWFLPGNVNGRS